MTAQRISDCEACRDAITELVCDELDAEGRAAVLAHTKTCEACAKLLSRFRGVLGAAEAIPLEAPSPRVRASVLQAAREAQGRLAAQTQGRQKPAPTGWKQFSAWLERFGAWAMSPQVAMASILLLMLGVGLVAFPMGGGREQAALRPAEEAAPPLAPSASATAVPLAQPEEAPAASAAPFPAKESSRTAEGESQKLAPEERTSGRAPERSEPPASDYPAPSPRGRPKASALGAEPSLQDDGFAGLASKGGAGPATTADRAFPAAAKRPAAPVERSAAADLNASAELAEQKVESPSVFPLAEAPAPMSPPVPSPERQEKKSAAVADDQLLAQGIRAAQSGDAKAAIAMLRPLSDQGSPTVKQSAARWLARSYRAIGDCPTALRYYAPLTTSKNADVAVLSEAADCYQRVGDTKQAALLRARAEPHRAARSKATQASPAAEMPEKPADLK